MPASETVALWLALGTNILALIGAVGISAWVFTGGFNQWLRGRYEEEHSRAWKKGGRHGDEADDSGPR